MSPSARPCDVIGEQWWSLVGFWVAMGRTRLLLAEASSPHQRTCDITGKRVLIAWLRVTAMRS